MDHFDPVWRTAGAALIYALAYLAAVGAFAAMARRRGLATEGLRVLAGAALVGGLVGANLAQLLVAGAVGKTILGGFAGGYLAVVLMKRRIGLRRPTGDLFAVAFCVGEALGRLGCFVGGCCYGKVANVAWAVHDHAALRHPTQLYLSLAALGTLAVLLALERTRALPENGLFYVQGLLLCATRLALTPLRDASAGDALAVTLACALGIAFFGYRLGRMLLASARPFRLLPTRAT
jgi:phosphatidylglycerol---prolipoprotein diacylglyceryl transferase